MSAVGVVVVIASVAQVAAASSDRPFGTSVFDVVTVPSDGAVDVPTNAHVFFPFPLPLIVTLSTPSSSTPLVLDVIPKDGVPLGDLPADADTSFIIDDGSEARAVGFHTGPGPDTEAPSLVEDPRALIVTSDDEPPEVVLTMKRAVDDIGVAIYRADADDGHVFVTAAPTRDDAVSVFIGGFIDTSVTGAKDVTLTVVAIDFAGNQSKPSAPQTVHVPEGGPFRTGCGTASSTTVTPALLLPSLLALRRLSRRRGAARSRLS